MMIRNVLLFEIRRKEGYSALFFATRLQRNPRFWAVLADFTILTGCLEQFLFNKVNSNTTTIRSTALFRRGRNPKPLYLIGNQQLKDCFSAPLPSSERLPLYRNRGHIFTSSPTPNPYNFSKKLSN